MARRRGFTLIELLTVITIIGLLASIAAARFWAIRVQSYRAAVKSDMRNLAVEQERYFNSNLEYATSIAALRDVSLSQGVVVTIVTATSQGWSATATHVNLPREQCAYFMGSAPAPSPATDPGIIKCN